MKLKKMDILNSVIGFSCSVEFWHIDSASLFGV